MGAKYLIIGGGVAGLTAAIALLKMGKSVAIYERSHQLKGIGAGFGLAANAMQALDYLGLKQDVIALGHFLDRYAIYAANGALLTDPDTKAISHVYKEDNFAINRGDLHQMLLAKIPQEFIHLGKNAVSLDQNKTSVVVHFDDGSAIESDYLLIADGVHSKLRQCLLPNAKPRYAGYTCWRAIIDNSHINLRSGSETWGAKGRFGMTPLVGNKIYWYACINAKPKSSYFANYKVADLLGHFGKYHDPIPQILAATSNEQLLWNDIVDIAPLNQLAFGHILLLGDAGHATTPNMGQGACQALEDVAVLIDELKTDVPTAVAFKNVEKRRLKRTTYITNTSRNIGNIAQWEQPILIYCRDLLMRAIPNRLLQLKLNKLLKEDFMKI